MRKYRTLFVPANLYRPSYKNLFNSSQPCVAIAFDVFDNHVQKANFLFTPLPSPRYKTTFDNSPPPGTKGWTCRGDCSGGGG